MALLVLGNLGISIGGQVTHDDRHLVQSRSHRCAQSLGAEMNAVATLAIRGMHDQRLQDAALLDIHGEFFLRGLGKFGARVVRVLVEK